MKAVFFLRSKTDVAVSSIYYDTIETKENGPFGVEKVEVKFANIDLLWRLTEGEA